MENQIYSVQININKNAEANDDKFIASLKKKIAKGLKLAGIKIPGDKLEYISVNQSKTETSISFSFEDYPVIEEVAKTVE